MLEFRILGPLEIVTEAGPLAPLPAKPRGLLAILLLNAGRVVSAERLIAALWGDAAPPSAAKLLQGYVSRLRAVLPEPRLETRLGGYVLHVDPERFDLARFEAWSAEGRAELAAGRPAEAVARLRAALALWRGPPLEELADAPFAHSALPELEELHVAALEACADAELRLGRHVDVVAGLRELAAAHPYREAPRRLLMLALYRGGRQAEALEVYRDARHTLAEELGLEPGEELRRLEGLILAHAPELELERPPAPPAPAAPRADAPASTAGGRRLVSVVSVALADPAALAERLELEALHALVLAAWQRCTAIVEAHGGSVERYGDDSVVAAFGIHRVHEDDALRALRAAAELHEAGELPLRVGVESGQVFVGADAGGATFATGSPVRRAAQLADAAGAGEVLLGAGTWELVRTAVRAPPRADGRRLEGFAAEAPEPASPFIGRTAVLGALREALADVHRCRLVTVVGAAGLGKSRLAREGLTGSPARVLVGRCRAYGEGVTYGPLAEIVAQLEPGEPERVLDPSAAAAVREVIGATEAPRRAEETAWAFRRLFERLAAERPLTLVLEDIHWAEPALLDLLDHVAAFSTGCPLVLLCLTRPELLETRPAWAAPQPDRLTVSLEPLTDADSGELAERLGAGPGAGRLIELAEGNPLFLEHLVAMRPQGDEPLPTSVHAVLAARIDRLAPGERDVLVHASVEGRSFHVGALSGLPGLTDVSSRLVDLAHRGLIRAEPVSLAGEDAFRFAHSLIRETAYAGLSKQRRAEVHAHVAAWLAERPDALDEIVGHHLEQACRYRAELGSPDRALASAAARRLAAGGEAALTRDDSRAGAALLERAVALLAPSAPERLRLEPTLGAAQFETGRLEDAERVLVAAAAAAREAGDQRAVARALVELQFVRLHAGAAGALDAARRVAADALQVLVGDDRGQCRAWRLRAWIAWTESQAADADAAWSHALDAARRAGDRREQLGLLGWRASAAAFGPLPVPEAIERCTAIREAVRSSPVAHAVALRPLALLHALAGQAEEAGALIAESTAVLDELGRLHSAVSHHEAIVHMLAGDPAAAERRLREGYDRLSEMGEHTLLATTAARLAQAVVAQGRDAEAKALCETSARFADAEDLITQALWRATLARALTRGGRPAEAQELAREAVAFAERTDSLVDHGDALLALAGALAAGGRQAEAEGAARAALARYERKCAHVPAELARAWLATPHEEMTGCPIPSST